MKYLTTDEPVIFKKLLEFNEVVANEEITSNCGDTISLNAFRSRETLSCKRIQRLSGWVDSMDGKILQKNRLAEPGVECLVIQCQPPVCPHEFMKNIPNMYIFIFCD